MTREEIRLKCLEIAAGPETPMSRVLDAARKYEEFVIGPQRPQLIDIIIKRLRDARVGPPFATRIRVPTEDEKQWGKEVVDKLGLP